ncbi:hypothetical protein [Bradyrhizobium sp. G127]|uniref:hypothetical protein n=1 Tax=Bradyrhizobium sp. G127 TaxID=2904800 RepID=UPI001F23B976|nr:hypothetical protein [Bradyrhizobium sp. G127]MCF2522297.1 hypothetical protein [Bradyrhizobium sp. G127]
MADYYPLIARAIAGLDPSAPGESRRALYERARTALISQLRSVQPALSEAEITRERLALEDAVRRVEADAVRRAAAHQAASSETPRERSAAPSSAPNPPPQTRAPLVKREGPRPGDALRESARSARTGSAPPPAGRDRPPGRGDAPSGSEPRPPRNLRGDQPPPLTRAQPPGQPGLPTSMRDVRANDQPTDDTRMLDAWTEEARAGRRAPPQGSGMRDVVADANDLGGATRSARRTYAQNDIDPRGPAPYSYDESAEEAGRYQPSDRPRARINMRDEPEKAGRGFPLKSAIAVGVAVIAIGAAIWGGPKAYSLFKSLTKPAQQADTAPKDASGTRPKITDRVGQPGATQIAPVAQRVVLYDEDPSAPQGKQYVGSVIWRTEAVKVPAGQPADIGVRADIDIPERKIKMSLSIRRNTDASLPASHTAELTFVLPPDFGTTVANVPGILMKSNEQARGTPLAGLAVKVTDGFFLVGLSNVEADKSRNLQLLKERSWFDIPLVYANQRRSIVAIEKGAPGERAFNEAFTAWGQ